MIRKITLLFLACLTVVVTASAQYCATADIHNERMAHDPAYAAMYNAAQQMWVDYQQGLANLPVGLKFPLSNGDSVYEIPLVVHVIHTGLAVGTLYNPTDAQIINTINYVNKAFEANWTGYPTPTTGGTKIPLRFALAKRSPTCTATTGIIRINGNTTLGANYVSDGVNRTLSGGVSDAAVKGVSYWPSTEYYNIWVVNEIDNKDGTSGSFIAGYATYPPFVPVPNAGDGTVMLASQFAPNEITLVHELGHAFGLPHTFGNSTNATTCPPKSTPYNCLLDDDGVCDTDPNPQTGPGTCPQAPTVNICTGAPYGTESFNFMNYSNCQNRFTPGQRTKMMFNFKSFRGSLITSLGATALTPVTPAICSPANTNTTATTFGPGRIVITQGNGYQDTLMHVFSYGFSGDGNNAYIDNTCKHRVTLTSGVQYRMRVLKNGAQTEQVRVYIDYNNDGDFDDPLETLFSGNTPGSSNEITFLFTPPLAGIVNCTELRMRVRSNRSGGGSPVLTTCNNHDFGQTEDYSVLINGAGNSVPTRGLVTLQKPPEGGNPSCFNTQLKFRATIVPTLTPLFYRWQRKNGTTVFAGPAGAVDSTWTSTVFGNNDTVWLKVAYPGPCGIDTAISDTIVVQRRVTIPPAVSIAITKGTNPGCPDDTLRFMVVGNVNPGGNPTYTWHVGSKIRSTGNTPYLDTVLGDNTTVYVEMLSSAGSPCASPSTATSNSIVFTHTNKLATAMVALVSGTNPGCSGQTLGFAAVTTNEGKAPVYQWKVNGINAGTNSPTFSGVFNNGDQITYQLTSNSTCVLPANRVVNSNSITVQHALLTADVQIAIVGGTNTACQGHPVLFSANTANSGTNPNFEWMINNVPVANSNSPIFSSTTLNNGDQVSCVLIATDPCVANTRDTSTPITMIIKPSAIPSVNIAITAGKNPWCLDSLVEFTATPNNAGTNPNFEWLVNGFPTYNGPIFPNDAYLNGDVVVCRLNTTDGACYLPDTVYSAPETMIRSTLPDPPIIHLVGNMLITNKAGTYRWWGPAGLYTNGTNGQLHPTEKGLYMAVTDNNGCWSLPSNYLLITLLDISTVELPPVDMYPNPTKGELILDWGTMIVNMTISVYNPLGQVVQEEVLNNGSKKTLNLSSLANGAYYIVMKDGQGNTGTAKITLNR